MNPVSSNTSSEEAIILRQQWKLIGDCKLIPLGKGFFTIKLDTEKDRNYIKAGQWEVLNQVLRVRNWVSNFRPAYQRTSKAQFCSTCGIIRHLVTECYVEKNKNKDTSVFRQSHNVNKATPTKNAEPQKTQTTPSRVPFDICDITEREEDAIVHSIIVTPHSSPPVEEVLISSGRFNNLSTEESLIEEESVIMEVSKICEVVEQNSLQNSTVKYVNGSTGKVTEEVIPVTSWAKIVNKEMSMVIHNSSSSNKKGNIWLFWNKSISTPQVISMSSQMITISVGDTLISGVHAHVGITQRRFVWSEMELISELQKPWIILGDFNAITFVEEKFGGRAPNKTAMLDFTSCLNRCELIQAPKTGLDYSWSKCQRGKKRILCNLDRVVFNQKWLQIYGDWGYKVGIRLVSDHAPLLGGCATFVFMSKLKNLKKCLNEWNWKEFGDVNTKIQEVEAKVKVAMEESDKNSHDENAYATLVEAQNEYSSREVQYSTLMRQKSRTKWVKEGAANTSFFHTNLKIRQAFNQISELEDSSGNIITDQEKLSAELVGFFEKRFAHKEVQINEDFLNVIPNSITTEDQIMLDALPSPEEIQKIAFEIDPDSSPVPDGFSGIFYRTCWNIIQQDIVDAIQFCWSRKFIPKGLNSSFLVLLPKCQGAKTAAQFRPID
ncbi:uncharacterized protein LOC113312910 [Papaver somniferum]|uniref:uncharacterized protein LOC113312910 n=1 Tax=Papaver somniferum TaxID=3469 RepID=UPI000E7057C3|nr:uncharacterized protein LOC113312910 [Papaver somniferum]